jgi:5,10-methenyltetrahydromethanopterin hydrogenase
LTSCYSASDRKFHGLYPLGVIQLRVQGRCPNEALQGMCDELSAVDICSYAGYICHKALPAETMPSPMGLEPCNVCVISK